MTTTAPPSIDTERSGIPFSRLVRVEVRKMLDTRAGLWLLIITGLLLAATMAITLLVIGLNDNASITAQGFAEVLTIPLSLLLPVFAIVTVTGEWGQRTHLVTFTLEPHRVRVFGAKLVAVLILAFGTIGTAILLGAIGNVIAGAIGTADAVWNIDASNLAWLVGLQVVFFLMAFALATVLLSTPLAVVVFYVVALLLPFMVYAPLYFSFDWAQSLIPWIDINYAASPLITGMDFAEQPVDVGVLEYVQFVWTLVLWIGIPGVLGLNRVLRTEVK